VIERGLEKIETAITVGFSHAQVDPQVQTLDDAAGVELAGLEVVHQQVLVVAQRERVQSLDFNIRIDVNGV
jgi:hypothetical protein